MKTNKINSFVGKKRILFLIDQIYSFTGGTEQHISFLMKRLPEHNCEIYFGVLRELGEIDKNAFPVEPFYLGLKTFRSLKQIVKCSQQLVDFIKRNEIRIVHTFFPDSELIGLFAVRKVPTCTLIATRRNMGYWHTWKSLWFARLVNQVIPNFLANCEAVKKQTSQKEWVQHKKVHCIYNPYPSHRLSELDSAVSGQSMQIQEKEFVVGMVANVRPVKNYANFIQAAKIIYDKFPNVKFLIVGSTVLSNYKQSIDHLISKLNLEETIIFTNEVDNPIPYVELFDVAVLSSDSEGFSNALIEYGMSGIPTVATDVGGNKEVVINNSTGFVVPPNSPIFLAQSILKLLESPELRKEFGTNAQKIISRKFDPKSIVSAYLNYYENLLGDVSGRSKL